MQKTICNLLMWGAIGVFMLLSQRSAIAGMPTPLFKDVTRELRLDSTVEARLQVISIFLVTLLTMAFLFKLGWNYLCRDFSRLPQLSFGKSLFAVLLWGLLFVIVLTMISGARELMTPGAWKKNGLTYSLDQKFEIARRQQLEQLGSRLLAIALANEGQFPPRDDVDPPSLWEIPGTLGMQYQYDSGDKNDSPEAILVWENNFYEGQPFALLRNGTIKRLSSPSQNRSQSYGAVH